LFEFNLRGGSQGAAFIEIGDQFIALVEGPLFAKGFPSDRLTRAGEVGASPQTRSSRRSALRARPCNMIASRVRERRAPFCLGSRRSS
jgi:hypothetical protein